MTNSTINTTVMKIPLQEFHLRQGEPNSLDHPYSSSATLIEDLQVDAATVTFYYSPTTLGPNFSTFVWITCQTVDGRPMRVRPMMLNGDKDILEPGCVVSVYTHHARTIWNDLVSRGWSIKQPNPVV